MLPDTFLGLAIYVQCFLCGRGLPPTPRPPPDKAYSAPKNPWLDFAAGKELKRIIAAQYRLPFDSRWRFHYIHCENCKVQQSLKLPI